jgi:hypothetical protein
LPATRSAYWLARLEEQDLLCAPVRDLREALVDPQTLHNRMIMEGPGEGQTVRFVASPIQMSAAPVALRHAPPRLGQHTDEILALAVPRCRHMRRAGPPQASALRSAQHGGFLMSEAPSERPVATAGVTLVIDQHVATVTLNRPQALNAVDLATEAELQRIWTQIENDPEVRVVVLTGAGDRAFCAGADLKNPSVTGLEYWAAPRPAVLAASRCARRCWCR